MNFLEKDLEDIIFENDNDLLCERGLPISGIKMRQVNLGDYGIADLLTVERVPELNTLAVTVYELKKGKINTDALLQLSRYITGIKEYLIHRGSKCRVNIRGILIGDQIDTKTDFTFLYNLLEDIVSAYSYNYELDGMYFRQYCHDWKYTDAFISSNEEESNEQYNYYG